MRRKILLHFVIIAVVFLLCGCATKTPVRTGYSAWNLMIAKEYEELFSLYNSYGGSVCMGISGPYSDKAKAVEAATEKCVQYLAFYHGLAMQVDFGSVQSSVSDGQLLEYNVIGGTSDDMITEVSKEFEIVDIKWFGGNIGCAVFARIPGMASIKKIDHVLDRKAPTVNKHYVAIATSEGSYSNFVDAIEAATFRAAEALVDAHLGTINVSNVITETTTDQYRGDSYSISGNKLEGFAVLAYEYNVEDNKVYALAICNN